MAHYLLQVAYTPEAWAALLKKPENRLVAVGPVLESVGARFECGYFAFGDDDIVGIIDAPDNVSAAAISLAFNSGGAVRKCRMTPLMTMEEGLEAMRKGAAARVAYRPPLAPEAVIAQN